MKLSSVVFESDVCVCWGGKYLCVCVLVCVYVCASHVCLWVCVFVLVTFVQDDVLLSTDALLLIEDPIVCVCVCVCACVFVFVLSNSLGLLVMYSTLQL